MYEKVKKLNTSLSLIRKSGVCEAPGRAKKMKEGMTQMCDGGAHLHLVAMIINPV